MKATLSSVQHLPSAVGTSAQGRSTPAWLDLVREAVEAADYGTIQIKVHGGEVVQIESIRKIRVPSSSPENLSKPTARAEAKQPK